jgi:hypothetical protein
MGGENMKKVDLVPNFPYYKFATKGSVDREAAFRSK